MSEKRKKGFSEKAQLHPSDLKPGLEVITNTGKRFIYQQGTFLSGDGRHALSPELFAYFVANYGGGKAYKAIDLEESFVEGARLMDELTRKHDEKRIEQLGLGGKLILNT